MKKLIAAVILSGTAIASFAQSTDAPKNREEVQAELAAAKASGEYERLHSEIVDFSNFKNTKSREQVKKELEEENQKSDEMKRFIELYPS